MLDGWTPTMWSRVDHGSDDYQGYGDFVRSLLQSLSFNDLMEVYHSIIFRKCKYTNQDRRVYKALDRIVCVAYCKMYELLEAAGKIKGVGQDLNLVCDLTYEDLFKIVNKHLAAGPEAAPPATDLVLNILDPEPTTSAEAWVRSRPRPGYVQSANEPEEVVRD